MPRPPLPLLSLGALAVLTGLVAGVALNRHQPPEPPPEQRIGTSPEPTRQSGGDGPPMEHRGGATPVTTISRQTVHPTTTTTVEAQTIATQITSTTTGPSLPSVAVPKPSVSVPDLGAITVGGTLTTTSGA
ncbi:hypothetical protein ACQPZF_02195 [Actinosynnema sp. CS-041913]|uniref:hypothetical protein n=1 Tax=Actinosynnema sp. CS-041913 TaxID=3239917 RepID=UPI003D8BA763